jgi:hypothetical protein
MLQSHVSQFKVETALPELANRQIQQIEIELKNLQIIPRLRIQLAKGSIRRMIKYLEPDGRLRMAADLLQFEVAIGERTDENISFCEAQLQQDYFIFQKQPFFGNQPLLEQAFTLTVWYEESPLSIAPRPVVEELTLNRIINHGRFSRIAQFTLDSPGEGFHPASCNARWVTDFPLLQLPLISGVLVGVIEYHSGFASPDLEFTHPVSFLISELPEIPTENLLLQGAVSQINCRLKTGKSVSCEVKIEFSWAEIQPRPLACLMGNDSGDPREVRLKTTAVVTEGTVDFLKSVNLGYSSSKPGEFTTTVKNHRTKFSAGGILLTGILTVEAFWENSAGSEEYSQWDVPWDTLVSGAAPETVGRSGEIHSRVRAEPRIWRCSTEGLEVEMLITCHYQLIQSKWVQVLRGEEGHCPVWADVFTGSKTFGMQGETHFELPVPPLEIHRIEAGLSYLKLQAESGWVKVQGRLEAIVYYSDEQRQQRMELLDCQVQECFLWEGLEPGMQFDHAAELKFNSYTVRGANILYHYLFELEVESYRPQEIQVLLGELPSGPEGVIPVELDGRPAEEQPLDFLIEAEISLELGVPKEIAANRSQINRFVCRDAGNAILVEGNLSSELEYWDQGGFFRRELVDLPFWRFLQYPSEQPPVRQFIPEIRKCACQPVKAWPWRKGSVKISIEIELKKQGAKEETDEGLDAEPG